MSECSWDSQVLALSSEELSRLPEEILNILSHGTNSEFLISLSNLALDDVWTETIFAAYAPLFVDLAGRWVLMAREEHSVAIRAAMALSKVLEICPRLSVPLQEICYRSTGEGEVALFERLLSSSASLVGPESEGVGRALVLIFRVLRLDHTGYSHLVPPSEVQKFFNHPELYIRYLACRVLGILLHFTDKTVGNYVDRFCGTEPLTGRLDGKTIDYRYFDQWEEHRRRNLGNLLKPKSSSERSTSITRRIDTTDLCSAVLNYAGYLVPLPQLAEPTTSRLVPCPTAHRNIRKVAEAISSSQPTLITGSSGSGKSVMVEEIADHLGYSSKMLTLHLNSQTDAKLLIGLYTSGVESGSFKWQPGVLTTAVREGRWVLIEDLDRAPAEVMSVLLPLLDTRELLVPNLGGTIRAAPGFKLIGTIRTSMNPDGHETSIPEFLGSRHWAKAYLDQYSIGDLRQIISDSFPLLRKLSDRILSMYGAVRQLMHRTISSHTSLRPLGLQELLRFCTRCTQLWKDNGITNESAPIPASLNLHIFLEALDTFCAAIPPGTIRSRLSELIAEELHVSSENVKFALDLRIPNVKQRSKAIKYGRVELPWKGLNNGTSTSHRSKRPFAQTNHSLKIIESIASAVKSRDPCLLVGETGTGKTTVVQELAMAMGQKLFVVNLSQQSEAGDLLGGFKPVNIKALARPIKDEFDQLFDETLNSSKNEKFVTSLDRNFKRGEWLKVLRLWQEATKTATEAIARKQATTENPSKKRKLGNNKYERLSTRWSQLTSDMEVFRKHLHSGSKGFAFSFVEGNLIKAVRSGYWILLDEINLASADTLESLTDLLSSRGPKGPSILLSETGEIQRVHAHPDFRIFAAMNPATDVGKRELPSGIRSRFAEYYVSSCEDDMESMLQICSAYLGDYIHADRRVASDVAKLYQAIRTLEKDNRLVDGANQKPHFTLRTLSRTLTYAMDIVNTYGLRRSLYEGFCMSFLTLLDRSSIALVSPLIYQHLLASQKNIRSILHQIPKCPGDSSNHVQFHHYWMTKGPFPVEEQPHYIITPFVEANLLNLVRATSTRRYPILLQGPTSSGKTSMVEHLATISGNKFVRINNHEHTDLQEYLGTYVSGLEGLQFQDGILVKALREGHWLVLDELNLAPTDILEALNRLLDDNRELLVPETQELVHTHPNFMLFATQNPPGLYGGRKILSRAFRNRFLELHFDDIPEEELETILRERSQIAPSYCRRIVEVYKRLAILRQSSRLFEQKNSFATLRDLFRWALRDADNVEQLAIHGFMLLGERVRNATERSSVKTIIEEVMRVKIDESKMYNMELEKKLQIKQSGKTAKNISMTKAMSRLYVLVSAALKNHEPVLLIGDTGCGKTTICQVVAEVFGTELHILNAHQNTETGDIIGTQRPVRNRQQTTIELQSLLLELHNLYSDSTLTSQSFEDLLQWYADISDDIRARIPAAKQAEVQEFLSKSQALFEWSDGTLVTAMRAGHHFLLDEISLADDSVLERLNSVLESSRTILLAEKGTTDVSVTAHENFQFLATMNPGGDYGKKELSPALRNRFTEIWVPELNDDEDVLEIINAKLTKPTKHLAGPILSFAKWFDLNCAEGRAMVTLRPILAWIDFLNIAEQSLEIGIVHGAAMVYIDSIGADPSAKLFISQTDIETRRNACLATLQLVFQVNAPDIYYSSFGTSTSDNSFTIGPYTMKSKQPITEDLQFNLKASTTLRNALRIVRALQIPKPILIEGSPGVGKTTLIEAIARLLGAPLTRVNLSDQTDLMDLFGSDVPVENGSLGQFEWRDAPFLTAMQKGEWVLLDEMNLASQSVLEGLNACLDHRGEVFIPELGRSFVKHRGFTLFAAQNPHAQGGGRKGLPASFVNRFTIAYADPFSTEDMVKIATGVFPHVDQATAEALCSYINNLNSLVAGPHAPITAGGPWEFNLRDVLRWMTLIESTTSATSCAAPGDFEDLLVLGRLRTQADRRAVSESISPPFSNHSRSRTQYLNSGTNFLQCGYGFIHKGAFSNEDTPLQAHSNLSLLEGVMIAVQQNWPCLLVGQSGCGKSSLIHGLASASGAVVTTLPLNAEMDTMDILGGYEQVDQTRHLKSLLGAIRREVKQLWTEPHSEAMLSSLARLWPVLMKEDDQFSFILQSLQKPVFRDCSRLQALLKQFEEQIETLKLDHRAQFEWVDGLLIKAMENGNWLILDNANLCNSSVLDRLNALLEPAGMLSVNEHRLADGSPRLVNRHPAFRLFLTMDPRYGELSRAMRNRCTELYLPERLECNQVTSISLPLMSASDFLHQIDWSSMSTTQCEALLPISLSRLSISQYLDFDIWYKQIVQGLYNVPPQILSLLQDYHKMFANVFEKPSITQALRELHLEFIRMSFMKEPDILSCVPQQSIDPSANTALVSMVQQHDKLDQLVGLIDVVHNRLLLAKLRYGLVDLRNAIPQQSRSRLTQLEKSFLQGEDRKFAKESTAPVASLIVSLLGSLDVELDIGISSHTHLLKAIQDLLYFCQDLIELTSETPFDEGLFYAYLRLGHKLIQDQTGFSQNSPLVITLEQGLKSLNVTGTVEHMVALWTYFKPTMPASMEALAQLLKIESLSLRFEDIVWNSSASLRTIISLQSTLHNIDIMVGSNNSERLAEIECIVQEEENRGFRQTTSLTPYFREPYEMLRQHTELSPDLLPIEDTSQLMVLAGQPKNMASELGDARRWILKLPLVTGKINSPVYLGALRGDLPYNLTRAIQGVPSISLRRLSRFEEEVPLICELVPKHVAVISADKFKRLRDLLRQSILDLVMAYEALIPPHVHQAWRASLEHEKHTTTTGRDVLPLNFELPGEEADAQLVELSDHLRQIVRLLNRSESPHSDKNWACLGRAWITLATTCLRLYLPDHPFDPALGPKLVHQTWHKRRREIEVEILALKEYETKMVGRPTKLRQQMLAQKRELLGAEPRLLATVRPDKSIIVDIHAEFSNVQRTILRPLQQEESLSLLDNSGRVKDLRRHVAVNISRLEGIDRKYDDIVKPVVGFLRSLDLGLALMTFSAVIDVSASESGSASTTTTTPNILGLSIKRMLATIPHRSLAEDAKAMDHRFVELGLLVLQRDLKVKSEAELAVLAGDIFQQIHKEWKARLANDQEAETTRSSLYHFKGNEETPADESEELNSLFPTFDDTEESVSNTGTTTTPAALAQSLAELHTNIFSNKSIGSQPMLNVLVDLHSRIARAVNLPEGVNYPFSSTEMLPGLIAELNKMYSALTKSTDSTNLSDFYNEPNLSEARKLVNLAGRLQQRFRTIQQAWPEHATIGLVLQTIDDLLDYRHTEPLARLITTSEKLHGFVYEWQTVASREFSAVVLYDELTQLLVSWRRIELSTWSRLLDREEQRHVQIAHSWWFVAYDAILHPFHDSGLSQDEAQRFAIKLSSGLQTFVKSASLGQFATRVSILRSFRDQAAASVESNPAMSILFQVLSNTITYFTRWQPVIRDNIKQKRAALDKKMKDTILLASWKDTNIAALRASARRSHNTLFRIIKKYRDALELSVESLLATAPDTSDIDPTRALTSLKSQLDADITAALDTCRSSQIQSTNLPRRLSEPLSTATLMARVSKIPETSLEPGIYLESLTHSIADSIKVFQRETPAKLTEDNKLTVKHLKTRKRNLLADTLKELRQMGIRANLNLEALDRQDTTAKILAGSLYHDRISSSEYDLLRVLDNMADIKSAARQHSSDLTPMEVTRCIGFAEGILHHIIAQRQSLCSTLKELERYKSLLDSLCKLWQPQSYSTHLCKEGDTASRLILSRMRWIRANMQTAREIISMTAAMAHSDYTDVVTLLKTQEGIVVSLIAELADLPNLSLFDLNTSKEIDTVSKAHAILSATSAELERHCKQCPKLRFVLTPLLSHLNLDGLKVSSMVNDSNNGTDIPSLSIILDELVSKMLVGIQRMKMSLAQLPASHEQFSWLISNEEVLIKAGGSLQVGTVFDQLQSELSSRMATGDAGVTKTCALAALILPLVQQYYNSYAETISSRLSTHISFCRLASLLSTSLKQIISQGFCTPKEDSKAQQDDGQAEGVGLGEGEGAEDISKDVEDDEDMTELAQGAQKEKDSDEKELDKEDNAVDLGDEDLEGKFDEDGEERGSEMGEDGEPEEENDMQEEVGDVDDLDPSAVDEKMWEDEADKENREKDGKADGKEQKEGDTAVEEGAEQTSDTVTAEDGGENLEEHPLDDKQDEKLDPHVEEGENLDLPEDMQVDGAKPTESDDDLMVGLSDLEEEAEPEDTETGDAEDMGSEEESVSGEQAELEDGEPRSNDDDHSYEFQDAPEQMLEDDGNELERQQENDPNDANNNKDDVQTGTGLDTNQDEAKDEEFRGDARNTGTSTSERQADDMDTAQSEAQNGEIAQAKPDNESGQKQDGEDEASQPSEVPQAFRKLGEALEKWRRAQNINEASEQQAQDVQEQSKDVQHLNDENDKSDAQVLGPAANDEVHALTKDELDMEVDADMLDDEQPVQNTVAEAEDIEMDDVETENNINTEKADTFIGGRDNGNIPLAPDETLEGNHYRAQSEDKVEEIDNELSEVKLGPKASPAKSMEGARQLWQQCESDTRDLSLALTEQLRLILAPSLATKMRGDFRTGKRLNIKRIIPYIASGYKRDKIWMRRSVPSKRSYQVMLAVDDSKSMTESGSSKLAFETLALLSRSLSMLEVGQICVASFGEDFHIAHRFEQQFSTESAINMFNHFSFDQTKTNVRNLMAKSLETFREARAKAPPSGSDLWQLQLIISDGVCEDHESIRRLVRQAHEERIMIVFAVINSAGNHSILNMTQASFEPDENGHTKLKIKRYLDGFPFQYYLIVGDIRNLPGVLSTALRQWFAEVADSN